MNMQDPTREEMLATLGPYSGEEYEFDREEAIYWFANDWHGGQTSNLYSVLSMSPFKPGPIASMDADSLAAEIYEYLKDHFGIPEED